MIGVRCCFVFGPRKMLLMDLGKVGVAVASKGRIPQRRGSVARWPRLCDGVRSWGPCCRFKVVDFNADVVDKRIHGIERSLYFISVRFCLFFMLVLLHVKPLQLCHELIHGLLQRSRRGNVKLLHSLRLIIHPLWRVLGLAGRSGCRA